MNNRGNLSDMSRQTGISEQYFSSRIGNTQTLKWPLAIQPPASATPTPIPNQSVLLLEADLSGTQPGLPWQAGSWVLSLDAIATYPIESGQFEGVPILPAKATVQIGTGGANLEFDLDVRNNAIALPASNVRVLVGWNDSLPPNTATTAPVDFICPETVRIVGLLQRSYSAGVGKRTLVLPQSENGAWSYRGAIPNFARCVRYWGGRTVNPGASYGTNLHSWYVDPLLGGEPLDNIQMNRFANPSGLPVPSWAQAFAVDSPAVGGISSRLVSVEFDIQI
jgi:hypothetical protein